MQELEERTGAAYAAKTRLRLQQLTQDLPAAAEVGDDQREPIAGAQDVPARAPCLLTMDTLGRRGQVYVAPARSASTSRLPVGGDRRVGAPAASSASTVPR